MICLEIFIWQFQILSHHILTGYDLSLYQDIWKAKLFDRDVHKFENPTANLSWYDLFSNIIGYKEQMYIFASVGDTSQMSLQADRRWRKDQFNYKPSFDQTER